MKKSDRIIVMYENFRLFFSILWLAACGCVFASALAVLVSWGGYLDYLYASIAMWCIATIGTVVTSV